MTSRVALVLAIALAIGSTARAQTPPAAPAPIEPDRPDVTNGAHIVEAGLLQFELGGTFTRVTPGQDDFGSPITVRIGIAKWLEARIGTDGVLSLSEDRLRETGLGNVQLGAKIRLWGDEHGVPLVSVLTSVNLPTGSAEKGLSSGDPDYGALLLTGVDLGARGHIDFNYGIAAIGAGGGRPHFVQHLGSASANLTIDRWSPYIELYAFSKMDPDGGVNTAVDWGVIYTVNPRLAIDGGMQVGISRAAPGFAVFGGASFAISVVRRRSGATSTISRSAGPKSSGRRAVEKDHL